SRRLARMRSTLTRNRPKRNRCGCAACAGGAALTGPTIVSDLVSVAAATAQEHSHEVVSARLPLGRADRMSESATAHPERTRAQAVEHNSRQRSVRPGQRSIHHWQL